MNAHNEVNMFSFNLPGDSRVSLAEPRQAPRRPCFKKPTREAVEATRLDGQSSFERVVMIDLNE